LAKLLADQGGTDKIYLMGGDPLTQQTAEMQKLMNDLLAVGYRRFFVETPLSTSVRWLVRFRESNPSIRLYIIANVLLVSSGMTELSDESNYELLGRHDVLHLICRDQADLDDARTTISRFASAEQPPILQFGASDEQREGWLQDAIMRLDDPMFDRFDIRIL
jgi:organic radical activating enzyme